MTSTRIRSLTLVTACSLLLWTGCAALATQECAPPATGQIVWYQNNGAVASCDDFAGYDRPTDVPPSQDGRLTAGCPVEGRYEVDGPVVVDHCTGLVWQRTPSSGTRTWSQALVFVRNLVLGGFEDWRAPNVNELLTIVDYGRTLPAINPVFDVPGGDDVSGPFARVFWTSTSDHGAPQASAWAVDFNAGEHSRIGKAELRSVRAVRGGFVPTRLPVVACELEVSP